MGSETPKIRNLITPRTRACGPGTLAGLATLALLNSVHLEAVGFRLPNQDPEGIARGNAFAATADNPSAIYYNPAGITQLEGQQIRVGVYAISTGVEHISPTGQRSSPNADFQPVPQLYYVNSPKDSPFSFGAGLYSPYGLAIDWGHDTPFRTRAEEGKLLYLTFNPVVAWQIHETLSIAAGPNISYSEAEFKQGIFVPGDQFRFKGDDLGYSFNAGLRWQPHKQWAFGVNYRYLTTMNYDGHSETTPNTVPPPLPPIFGPAYFGSTPTTASIRFPQSVATGVSFRPTENWNIEFNADWTDWDNVNEIALQGPPLPPMILNYSSSWMYEFGITRKFQSGYFISTGYIFSENSSPDAGFSPLIPDSDLHLGSIGF
ncbi:MAG TPA: outer membrane protein transport protein, partial [Verrucomicrobiae bacterium]|nr:outer membrane protein transport protein [Verrucomicrobiae bacterium]